MKIYHILFEDHLNLLRSYKTLLERLDDNAIENKIKMKRFQYGKIYSET